MGNSISMVSGTTIGIDIGGTFTDMVAFCPDGRIYKAKVSSSFRDSVNGVAAGLRSLLTDNAIKPESVSAVVHGTTVATNAILERKGASTALVTTAGFRDVLEIGRLRRSSLYDIFWDKPVPLVRRALRFEVRERMDFKGEVLIRLDPDEIREKIVLLREAGVNSLAVSLLNAYANPAHENVIADIVRREHPDLFLSISTEISPEIKEYERTSTAVINAYIQPIVADYVDQLIAQLRIIGLKCPLLIMQSNGGLIDAATARRFPVRIVESGPAAGVLAASYLATQSNRLNVIAFDMGGTTAKASLIEDGCVPISMEYEVGAGMNAGHSLSKGGGYPIRVPSVNISEVGAGGGSVAWIDSGGALRVGPHSAGAEPGPACYAAGGTEPTVTDANVVLGYMNPSVLAGGRLRIDRDLARRAIEEKIANPLGMGVLECAFGIHTIANANMIRAVRSVTTERGRDPRTHVLVSFGGAGPLHAVGMAALLDIPEILVPVSPGLFSAIGLQFADTTCDFAQTFLRRLSHVMQSELERYLSELEAEARRFLDERQFEGTKGEVAFYADLRYLRQSHELSIPLARSLLLDGSMKANLGEQFANEYERIYGYRDDNGAIEIVNLRSRAIGRRSKMSHVQLWQALDVNNDEVAQPMTRDAYFGSELGSVACSVFSGRRSLGSKPLRGPMIIEEFDTTIVVPPGATVTLDAIGNVVIDRAGEIVRVPIHQVFQTDLAGQAAP